jgi:molybdate transport system substrate-binding protein
VANRKRINSWLLLQSIELTEQNAVANGGSYAKFARFVDDRLTIIVLMNLDDADVDSIVSGIAEFYLPAAGPPEIKVWTARAIATVLAEVGPQFEATTGHKLTIVSDLPNAFVRRANAGEPFDILISGLAPVDEWIKDGKIIPETRTDIARSGIGVEVRAGARKPDIGSIEAFKRALLDAKSIAYLRVGSGIYLAGMLERLGIAEAIKSKVTRPESDIVSELVAKGEVELGMVVITQILTTPGVELVGPLPPEIQSYVTFTAGISANSKVPEAARQLIKFLTGPVAAPVIKAQGMEPGGSSSR